MIPLSDTSASHRLVEDLLGGSFPHAPDIAAALESFCAPDATVSQRKLLLSRILLRLGHDAEACRVLESDGHPPQVSAVLTQREIPRRALSGIGSRLLRPVRRLRAGDAIVWVLDLFRLRADPLNDMELVLLPALRALIEEAAPVWDGSNGFGFLGLRGVERLRLPSSRVEEFTRACLADLARRRLWSEVPTLLRLDG